MRLSSAALTAMLVVAACRSQAPQPQNSNLVNEVLPAEEQVTTPPAPDSNLAQVPQAPPAIDPRSPEAAVAVVRNFANALDQRRFHDAFTMQSSGMSEAEFVKPFADYKNIRAEVGQASGTEGAAGSIYTTVPLTLSGTKRDGRQSTITGSAIVRRVNDVPGSTAAQRRWHIERIEWKAAS